MPSIAEYGVYAGNAAADALDYRIEAVTAREPRRSMLLKWADQREADAAFYLSRAALAADAKIEHEEAA